MGFSTNYEDVNDGYGLVAPGEYEVVIRNIEEKKMKSGSTGLSLSLVIRNDVRQKCQNRYVFHTLWKRKEPTKADMQVQGYSFKQIMTLAKSAKLPNGKSYETVQQLCEDLLRRPIKVTIEHEEYNGKEREHIKYFNESEFPDCRHVFKEKKTDMAAAPPQDKSAGAAPPPPQLSGYGDLSDFEEILSDGDVPF